MMVVDAARASQARQDGWEWSLSEQVLRDALNVLGYAGWLAYATPATPEGLASGPNGHCVGSGLVPPGSDLDNSETRAALESTEPLLDAASPTHDAYRLAVKTLLDQPRPEAVAAFVVLATSRLPTVTLGCQIADEDSALSTLVQPLLDEIDLAR